jgi:hypothetical protein
VLLEAFDVLLNQSYFEDAFLISARATLPSEESEQDGDRQQDESHFAYDRHAEDNEFARLDVFSGIIRPVSSYPIFDDESSRTPAQNQQPERRVTRKQKDDCEYPIKHVRREASRSAAALVSQSEAPCVMSLASILRTAV